MACLNEDPKTLGIRRDLIVGFDDAGAKRKARLLRPRGTREVGGRERPRPSSRHAACDRRAAGHLSRVTPAHDDHTPDDQADGDADDIPESGQDWRRPAGAFVLIPIGGEAGDQLDAMRRRFDPKLAATNRPHLSLIGSSGAGPIVPGETLDTIRERLIDVASVTPPFTLRAGLPMRFPGTDIVSFELDAHGPLRDLHERVKASGLRFGRVRFPFSPHLTISFYRTLERAAERELLSLRLTVPLRIDTLEVSRTNDPQPPETVVAIPLGG